jgi:Protein kinase domain
MEPGTVLAGRYRLDRKLGNGAMGQLWHSFDLRSETAVAIKMMLTAQADPDLLMRFEREAVVAAGLRSPRIVTVYEAGRHEKQFFIVMELLDGQDLGQVLRGAPGGLPVARALNLAIQLAGGLATVHEKGIVHRDLKPENLFIEAGDQLKICDFGIARDNSLPTPATYQWPAIGTPEFMAPERWQGQPAGPSSDLYAVGCVLYELLTGHTPFGPSPSVGAIILRHINEEPVPPRERNPAVPGALSDLTLALLAKDPADRPASAAEVDDALREIRRALVGTGAATAPVACSSRGLAHLGLFMLNGLGTLRHRSSWWPELGWLPWEDMPLPAGRVAAVAAGSHDDHQQELAVAIGETVHHTRWWQDADGDHWADWHEMPALDLPVRDLAMSSLVAGHLEVFAADSDGAIHHRWYGDEWFDAPGWSDWHDMPGPEGRPVSAITVGSQASHHQEIFAVADGAVWHRWFWRGPRWADWAEMPGLPAPAVDVACSSLWRMHLEVYALDDVGRIWHRWYWPDPGWSDWARLPGPAGSGRVTAITAGSHSRRQQFLFACTADGQVHCAEYQLTDKDWSPWREMTAS